MANKTTKSSTKKSTSKSTAKKSTKPAVKKTTAKSTKPAVKKTTTKPAVAKEVVKVESKKTMADIYNTNVSILLVMVIEAMILLLGYLIIMSAA